MAGFSDAAENDIIDLIFNATAWPDMAENDSSSPATNITVALHTADPTDAGNQTSNEAAYTSYARENVARTSGGWTVSGASATLTSAVSFTAATGGSETETHFSCGTGTSNYMIGSGTVSPNISVSSGVTPQLTTSTSVTLD